MSHLQARCKQMKKNLKKLREMKKDNRNSETNVVRTPKKYNDNINAVLSSVLGKLIIMDNLIYN